MRINTTEISPGDHVMIRRAIPGNESCGLSEIESLRGASGIILDESDFDEQSVALMMPDELTRKRLGSGLIRLCRHDDIEVLKSMSGASAPV